MLPIGAEKPSLIKAYALDRAPTVLIGGDSS